MRTPSLYSEAVMTCSSGLRVYSGFEAFGSEIQRPTPPGNASES